jgi:hypothetical protein
MSDYQFISSLQAALQICKPKAVIPFSIRFLQDEKQYLHSPNLGLVHAIQMMPFLISQPEEMKDNACIIFCALQSQNFSSTESSSLSIPIISQATTNYFREYLDGNQVLDIIQLMDLQSLGLSHAIIEEVKKACNFDFLFVYFFLLFFPYYYHFFLRKCPNGLKH